MKLPRKKKCAVCHEVFQPTRPFQSCCEKYGLQCALEKARKDRSAKTKKALMERRKNAMSIKERQVRARLAAQAFARARDIKCFKDRGENPKCILCGSDNPKSWHGCHFVPVGSKGGPKSFHPANINLGCSQCNFFANQSATQYRENMIVKYGVDMVEYLETASLDYTMTADEIDEIWQHYRKEIKLLK